MPRTIAQNLKLYTAYPLSLRERAGVRVTSPYSEPALLVAVLDPSGIRSLEHGTRLPGGFDELSLTIAATESEFRDWRQDRLLDRLVLEEPSGRTIWEGRIEGVALADRWQASLTARGYWSNLTDSVRNRSYVSGADTGGSIIADLLGDIHAQARQLSPSVEHVAAGPTIVHEYQDDWTIWRILTDRRRGVASFGSGAGARPAPYSDTGMDVAVWEDRKLHYRPRTVGAEPAPGGGRGFKPAPTIWHSYMRPENGGGVVNLPLRVDWRDLANAVSVTYERSGEIMRTPQTIDAKSIARHIRRERHVANIGESTSATAVQRRDTELNLRSRLRPTPEGLAVNRVWDGDGIEWPLCRVRAGDVIRIPDFTPSTDDLDHIVFDAYRNFFIEETLCDHVTGVLTIRPDSDSEVV